MAETKRKTAAYLLQSKAIILDPAKPFTWASGWLSPIYCDNRVTLSFPEIRDYIRDSLVEIIREKFDPPEVIAGVATGAIPQGALVADRMALPFIYVRSSPKGHGRQNMIEGRMESGRKVLVVEDLVSTGRSSLNAVEAIRVADGEVLGMVAVFTYGFIVAGEAFRTAGVRLETLTDYNTLVSLAVATGYIRKEDTKTLEKWREDPSMWSGPH
jgi:orotate phosphoribosyltransferase